MRKVLVLGLATAALAGLAPSQASALTHAQQDALLAQLKAKMACFVRYPVTQYNDLAWYGTGENTPTFAEADSTNPDSLVDVGAVTGIDYDYFSGTPNTWLIGIKNTSTCRGKFPIGANPHPEGPTASAKASALSRRAW